VFAKGLVLLELLYVPRTVTVQAVRHARVKVNKPATQAICNPAIIMVYGRMVIVVGTVILLVNVRRTKRLHRIY
jgi:hypothetical protein